jgi:hypothetical protein
MPFYGSPYCECKTERFRSMKQYDIKHERETVCVLTVDIIYYAVSKRQPVCWIINSFSKDRGMVGIVK